MKDVEKFKEKLREYSIKMKFGLEGFEDKEEELIKMYTELLELCQNLDDDKTVALERIKELEEPKEKPVIRCNYEFRSGTGYCKILWTGKTGMHHDIYSENYEEKDGMLITDDFIFIKED